MNGKYQRLLTEILSESYKISPGLSEIATRIRGRFFDPKATLRAEDRRRTP